jgi:UDP-N-acetylglucosamine 2-epimerase (non-hydrolysing)
MNRSGKSILVIFGTRPEVIKLAPVIQYLTSDAEKLRPINIASGQHTDLLYPFVRLFDIHIDYDLRIMENDYGKRSDAQPGMFSGARFP